MDPTDIIRICIRRTLPPRVGVCVYEMQSGGITSPVVWIYLERIWSCLGAP